MKEKKRGMLFKFSIVFAVFTVVTLVCNGLWTYIDQKGIYEEKYRDNARHLSGLLESLVLSDPADFKTYQDYIIAHGDEIDIPIDFNNYLKAKNDFYKAFAEEYPTESYSGEKFDSMTEELKKLYIIYRHEYFLLTFEKARETFNVPYTYYIVPSDEEGYVYYVIDAERTAREENSKYMVLADCCNDSEEVMPVFYKSWNLGKNIDEYDRFDNEYGLTNSYYTILEIDGKKQGMLCVDTDVTQMYTDISRNTAIQMVKNGLVTVAVMAGMLLFINKRYIKKLVALQENIKDYSDKKDPGIVNKIEQGIRGYDEIATLSKQTAEMILELENYMNSLLRATKELSSTKELAHKDALTGVGNKVRYDTEMLRLDHYITENKGEFGLIMIDLNFLKLINDTYGHDVGNLAIRKVCSELCNIFPTEKVFRIGGDEFVVIIEGELYPKAENLVEDFKEAMKNAYISTGEGQEKVSVAVGLAMYDKNTDKNTESVFKRADKYMYENKKKMKAVRT
ncbi:MAG: GGDEF domain-containing protein [Firmicutes bacterium]|nr:GGDEF domain-containing protein [Bacillota bacterium]